MSLEKNKFFWFTKLISLREAVSALDVFSPSPFRSARKYVQEIIGDILLTDMLLCPLMYYGSSIENDMDLSQFGIMFQAIYLQGMHRPSGTIKDFLDMLLQHYQNLGGSIKLSTGVKSIICEKKKITGVELKNGDVIHCDHLLSSVGLNETYELLGADKRPTNGDRLGFVESIFVLPKNCKPKLSTNKTIIFYNTETSFNYRRPKTIVDFNSGVVCFPAHFHDRDDHEYFEIRSTHLANYHGWLSLYQDYNKYTDAKATVSRHSCSILNNLIGNFQDEIIFHDTFTPVTISRFTGKNEGAIYGSPVKVKDGNVGYDNLHLIGTDQGFLGIIGSMLSGVSMVNQHVLPKI